MKVKYAMQVLSHSVANFIDVLLTFHKGIVQTKHGTINMPKAATITADTIFLFDELFDSFNGKKGQGLSSIITQNSGHLEFWQEALHKLKQMEFVDAKTHKSLNRNKPKCLTNWIRTIEGAKILWEILQKNGFKSLNLKHLNQDPIENLFSQIRDHGHRNVNPTPYLFGTAFKALLTCNLTSKHSMSANCEKDKEDFQPLLSFFKTEQIMEREETEETEETEENVECSEATNSNTTTSTNFYFDVHKTISLLKRKMKMECTECIALLENNNTIEVVKHAMEIVEMQFLIFCHETKVKKKLIQHLSNTFPKFHCTDIQNNILNNFAHQFILEWCNFINKIFRGKETQDDLNTNNMYYEAQRMSSKYRKKVKNKTSLIATQ